MSTLSLTETLAPSNTEAVAQAVRDASERGQAVYPIGGGTASGYGVWPTETGLGLSLAGMNRLVDYPARDLTITVEAGMTIAQLQERLAAEGQRLPVDIPQADRATVGGAVATSPSGPRRYRFGTLRDYVIGLRAVDGTGMLFSSGGRVVKNAAGYGLTRLLTGSLGTLGVIVQVTFMVKPVAQTQALVACDVPDFEAAERLLADLTCTPILPTAIELLAGPAWQTEDGLKTSSSSAVGRLVVGLEGSAAEVDWMVGELQDAWRKQGIVSPVVFRGAEAEPRWKGLEEFPAVEPASEAGPCLVQIGVLPSEVTRIVKQLLAWDPQCSIQAHAGDGTIVVRSSLDAPELQNMLAQRLRPELSESGGTAVVLSQPGGSGWDRQMVWGPPSGQDAALLAIKQRFDPKGILNRGRYIFR